MNTVLVNVRILPGLICWGLCLCALSATAHAQTHTVKRGDSVAKIARIYRVTIAELKKANRMRSNKVTIGERLNIPGGIRRRDLYKVRRGDNLNDIANKYKVTVAELRKINRLRQSTIRPGMRLRIPGRRRENPLPTVAPMTPTIKQKVAGTRAENLRLGTNHSAQRLLKREAYPEWLLTVRKKSSTPLAHRAPTEATESMVELDMDGKVVVEPDSGPRPPAVVEVGKSPLDGTLGLPIVDERYGWFMRGWGSGQGGYHLALDIYGPPGTQVKASERGMVVYAGEEISGYGRFVMLLHENGWVTAYAHNSELLVVPGEFVSRGQVLALSGNTGLSRGPHLHFMLIHNGRHCDPAPLFNPGIKRRNGNQVVSSSVRWVGAQPTEVRCLKRSQRPHPSKRRKKKRSRKRRRRK